MNNDRVRIAFPQNYIPRRQPYPMAYATTHPQRRTLPPMAIDRLRLSQSCSRTRNRPTLKRVATTCHDCDAGDVDVADADVADDVVGCADACDACADACDAFGAAVAAFATCRPKRCETMRMAAAAAAAVGVAHAEALVGRWSRWRQRQRRLRWRWNGAAVAAVAVAANRRMAAVLVARRAVDRSDCSRCTRRRRRRTRRRHHPPPPPPPTRQWCCR